MEGDFYAHLPRRLGKGDVAQLQELGKIEAFSVIRGENESSAPDLQENRAKALHEIAPAAKRSGICDICEGDCDALERAQFHRGCIHGTPDSTQRQIRIPPGWLQHHADVLGPIEAGSGPQ